MGKQEPGSLARIFRSATRIEPDEARAAILSFLFLFLLMLGIMGLIFMLGMYNYSTKPGFCRSCHIMEPYYQAWATSTHKDHATCVTCHYPPTGSALPMS